MRTNKKVLDLEAKIGLGQAEELIEMAKDELKVLPKYIGQFLRHSPMIIFLFIYLLCLCLGYQNGERGKQSTSETNGSRKNRFHNYIDHTFLHTYSICICWHPQIAPSLILKLFSVKVDKEKRKTNIVFQHNILSVLLCSTSRYWWWYLTDTRKYLVEDTVDN